MTLNNYDTDDYQSSSVDYISKSIVQLSWQHDCKTLSDDRNKMYCCLGISPSQFRRLISTRQELSNTNEISVLYARTALQYTLEQMNLSHDNSQTILMVLIVDSIQKYNFAVFHNKHITTGVALKYALDEGAHLYEIFSQARSQLPLKFAQHVSLLRWHDIHDVEYEKYVTVIRAHLLINEEFHKLINAVVQNYIDVRKPHGNLSETKRELLREYVLYELPALIRGISYGNYHCSVIIHPTLNYSTRTNVHQRNAMIDLLEYVRKSPILCAQMGISQSVQLCNVYDIDMPVNVSLTSSAIISTTSSSVLYNTVDENGSNQKR